MIIKKKQKHARDPIKIQSQNLPPSGIRKRSISLEPRAGDPALVNEKKVIPLVNTLVSFDWVLQSPLRPRRRNYFSFTEKRKRREGGKGWEDEVKKKVVGRGAKGRKG